LDRAGQISCAKKIYLPFIGSFLSSVNSAIYFRQALAKGSL